MIVVLIFVVCLLIGMPIAFLLGLTGVAHIAYMGDMSYFGAIINRMFAGLNSTGLSAIPFFIIAGEMMNEGGITKRLFALFRELVIQIRGGLAYAVVIVSAVLAAILGSANAVSSILCKVAIPEMKEDGYTEEFSGALIASSAVLGPIIPPSTTFVYYSVLTGVSVRSLFLAGIVPGILLALGFIAVIFVSGKIFNLYPAPSKTFSFRRVGKAFVEAIPALLIPLIMMGGILTGIFTPAESGTVAVVASIIVGLLYKTLDLKKAARAVGEKSVAMLPGRDLLHLTGYVHGGCSPVGMKKQFPTVLHASALEQETIVVSGGRIGVQVELQPQVLCTLLRAAAADVVAEA